MNLRETPLFVQLAVPFTILVLGLGILVWLASVPGDPLDAARSNLLGIADWMIKASVGALLGFGGNAGIRARSGNNRHK